MKNKNEKLHKFLFCIPFVLFFCVLPFVVYYALYESRLSEFAWAPEEPWAVDFYLYYKQMAFFVFTVILLLLMIYLVLLRKKCGELSTTTIPWKQLIPVGVYFVLTLVSSLFSKYKKVAFAGCDGQFESFFVITGYLLLLLYIVLWIRTEKDLQTICSILGVLFGLSAVLGLLQVTGNNPMNMEWFQRLVTPKGYLESGATITSVFGVRSVSLFAYNPNYAGVLLALMSVFCFGYILTEKNFRKLMVELLLLVALLVSLIGTGSKAGFLTFGVVAIIAVLFFQRRIRKCWYVVFPVAACIIICCLLFIRNSDIPLLNNIKTALSIEKQELNPLQKMITAPDGVYFTYKDASFRVSFEVEEGSFDFSVVEDGEEIPLVLSADQTYYSLQHPVLTDVTIRPGLINEVLPLFVITMNGREWMFVKASQEENVYYYLNQYLRLEKLDVVERFGFEGYENLASTRGLLWSLTIPLLKKSILLGTGADTFACFFPQNDYKNFYYYYGDAVASSRPHSMYLKIGVESGILALAALLVFWGWYIVQSTRIYLKGNITTPTARIGFACFLAVVLYLICGISNDSMITVAPVFWGILGIGIAANKLQKEATVH